MGKNQIKNINEKEKGKISETIESRGKSEIKLESKKVWDGS
jgi:hypothetical protein